MALPKDFRNLLLSLPTASEEEAARITIQIQNYLKDEEAERAADPDYGIKQGKLLEQAALRGKAEEEYARQGEAWVDDIMHRAQSQLPGKDDVDRLKAKGAKFFEEARKTVRGHKAAKQMHFDQLLRTCPTEEIMVTGNWMMVGSEENQQHILYPDVIQIMHRKWVLEPGVQQVPSIVAEAYRNAQNGRAEARAREAVLRGPAAGRLYDAGEIEMHWDDIDAKYGTERKRFQGG